jgi:predicted RNase H-like HicB family nuclease
MSSELTSSATNSRYEMVLYWSAEDRAFVAAVPELPGCAADGVTREQALQNAVAAIQVWIETALEVGRAIPSPKGRPGFA